MGFRLAVTLLVLTTSFGFGQSQNSETLCDAAAATTINQLAGVIVQKVRLRGTWGRNEATVYLPDKKVADGAVVFSHSAIQSNTGTSVDLLPVAFTLAHAGAAVIVPSRTLIWPPTPPGETEIWQRSANREGAVVICAEHWLIDHTKVFNNGEPIVDEKNVIVGYRYAYIGPGLCAPVVPRNCASSSPFRPFFSENCAFKRYCRESVGFPIGETEGGDNTLEVISKRGLGAADFIHEEFGLAPIKALMAAPSAGGKKTAVASGQY